MPPASLQTAQLAQSPHFIEVVFDEDIKIEVRRMSHSVTWQPGKTTNKETNERKRPQKKKQKQARNPVEEPARCNGILHNFSQRVYLQPCPCMGAKRRESCLWQALGRISPRTQWPCAQTTVVCSAFSAPTSLSPCCRSFPSEARALGKHGWRDR